MPLLTLCVVKSVNSYGANTSLERREKERLSGIKAHTHRTHILEEQKPSKLFEQNTLLIQDFKSGALIVALSLCWKKLIRGQTES